MKDVNNLTDLFEPKPFNADTLPEFESFLDEYQRWGFKYPGKGNRNTGYIFRGDLAFPTEVDPIFKPLTAENKV